MVWGGVGWCGVVWCGAGLGGGGVGWGVPPLRIGRRGESP